MAAPTRSIMVFVTCKSPAEAKRIARAAVKKHLAACGSVFDATCTSIYRWKGRIEQARETQLLLKTTRSLFPRLEAEVRRLHGYDVPEIVAVPIVAGSVPYLAWLRENVEVRAVRPRATRRNRRQ
jgi:periplasmic divalent cation tolerance protein